jgi:SAM-dependent methyltransferase
MYEELKKFIGKVRPCILCGEKSKLIDRTVWAQDDGFDGLLCNKCGLVQVEPCLTPEGLNFYYSTYLKHRLEDKEKFQQRSVQYKIDSDFLKTYVAGGKILDVGCSGGFFLNEIGNKFTRVGLEIDNEAASYGIKKFNLDIKPNVLGSDNLENNSFDVITFRGVIEHIYNPVLAITRAKELLKPHGRIYICATPNLDCFCAEVYREMWNLWHPIQHINIFNLKTLHKLIGKDEFDIEAVNYPYLGTPYENFSADTKKLLDHIYLKQSGKKIDEKSPPFWGNMINIIFKKN